MGQKFAITAQVNLMPPRNLRQVASQIHSALSGGSTTGGGSRNGAAQQARQTAQLTAALNGLSQKARTVTTNAKQMNAALTSSALSTKKAASEMYNFGRQAALAFRRASAYGIAVGGIYGLVRAMTSATKAAIQYQHENVRIAQILRKPLSATRELNAEITRLATGWGLSSQKIQSIADTLTQAGLSARETKVALSALAKTELAPTFEGIEKTVEGAIAMMGQFGTQADDLEKQLGSLNAVSAKYAVESSDLIKAVKIAGGTFHQAGGELKEFIGLFTSIRHHTRESATSIATAMRTIFARLQRPKTQQKLEDMLGITLNQGGMFVGPMKAVEQLNKALASLPNGSTTKAMVAELVGGYRQLGKVLPLINNYKTALEAVQVAEEGENSLQKDLVASQESMVVQLTKVKEKWLELFRAISESTTFKMMFRDTLRLTTSLIDLAKALTPILPVLAAVGIAKGIRGSVQFGKGFMGGMTRPRGYATGGVVGGSGNRDSEPAMLTPGEAVLNRRAVGVLGADFVRRANSGSLRMYADGGIHRYSRAVVRPLASDPSDRYMVIERGTVKVAQKLEALANVVATVTQKINKDAQFNVKQFNTLPHGLGKDAYFPVRQFNRPPRNPNPSVYQNPDQSFPVKQFGKGTVRMFEGYPLAPLDNTYTVGHPQVPSRPLRPHQTAGSIPLVANSFEDNALAVVSGKPDEFAPATYGFAPSSGFRKNKYGQIVRKFKNPNRGRSLTREDREAFIQAAGRGGLLNRVRTNRAADMESLIAADPITQMQQQEAAYLSGIGYGAAPPPRQIGRNSLFRRSRLVARAIRQGNGSWLTHPRAGIERGLAGVRGYGRSLAGRGIALAGAAYALDQAGQHIGGTTGAAMSGLGGGALTGGLMGASVAGPMGAVAGATIGGVIGIQEAFRKLDRELANKAVEKGLKGVTDAAKGLGEALKQGSGAKVTQAARGLLGMQAGASMEEALSAQQIAETEGSTGRYWAGIGAKLPGFLGGNFFSGVAERGNQAHINRQFELRRQFENERLERTAPQEQAALNRMVSQAGSFAELTRNGAAMGLVRNQATRRVAGQHFENEQEYTKAVNDAMQKELDAIKTMKEFGEAVEDVINPLSVATRSFEAAAQRLMDFKSGNLAGEQSLDSLAASGRGGQTAIKTNFLTRGLNFGSAHFGTSLTAFSRIAPGQTESLRDLHDANHIITGLKNYLPTVAGSKEDLHAKVEDFLVNSGASGRVRRMAGMAASQEDLDAEGIIKKIEDVFEPLKESMTDVGKEIEDQFNNVIARTQQGIAMHNEVHESRNTAFGIRDEGLRFAAERLVARRGGDVTSYLPLSQETERQNASLGFGGMSVAQISQSALQMQAAKQAALQRFTQTGDVEAGKQYTLLEHGVNNATKALRNFADVTKRNASMQERLAALDKNRISRLNFGERLITASPEERSELMNNMMLARKASKMGNLDRFNDRQRKGIIDALNSAGDVTLFGGKETGEQLKQRLISNSFGGAFRPSAADQREAAALEQRMGQNFNEGVGAQNALTGILESTQQQFFSDLETNQRNFLQALAGTMGKPVQLPPPTTRTGPANIAMQNMPVPIVEDATSPFEQQRQQFLGQFQGLSQSQGRRARRKLSAAIKREENFQRSRRFRNLSPEAQQNRKEKLGVFHEALEGPLGKFAQNAAELGRQLAAIPHSIEMKGTHQVNVVINGAEALSKMQPEMQKMMATIAEATVRERMAKTMPELGIANVG